MTTTSGTTTVRRTGEHDAARIAALRRAWVEEESGHLVDDDGFEDRFAEWYAEEAARRVIFLAELGQEPVGMVNLVTFTRMPKPGRAPSLWYYLGNAFVLAGHRDRGIGTALLETAIGYARERGAVRIVLAPSERSRPFYRRAGFGPATMLLVKEPVR
ncbi:GNAT family N-acetyltransferase [Amycolatopsis balhimycina DSM 5908]|uniref:GNAT family N-acetyltransferase n=1 Tax=Amycolatopsis balhimycina DSM 5908 TaxID=1081091 RepID=A0A428W358_AMYBA|nr:GNAT family N-acetyltransferase [Amycolatopsis balhimycina]RSM37504.1 GNAT family N-acetyltransferase [Amycolatopsis balhimycina DSM 5908]